MEIYGQMIIKKIAMAMVAMPDALWTFKNLSSVPLEWKGKVNYVTEGRGYL